MNKAQIVAASAFACLAFAGKAGAQDIRDEVRQQASMEDADPLGAPSGLVRPTEQRAFPVDARGLVFGLMLDLQKRPPPPAGAIKLREVPIPKGSGEKG